MWGLSSMATLGLGELFMKVARGEEGGLESELLKAARKSLESLLEEVAKRVGFEAKPDMVIARTSIAPVMAAAALAWKDDRILKLLLPSKPLPGWMALQELGDILEEAGIARVYRVDMSPKTRPTARDVATKTARIVKACSPRVVDVTDAPPYTIAPLYSAGVRVLTVLVPLEYAVVFQKFSFITPL